MIEKLLNEILPDLGPDPCPYAEWDVLGREVVDAMAELEEEKKKKKKKKTLLDELTFPPKPGGEVVDAMAGLEEELKNPPCHED